MLGQAVICSFSDHEFKFMILIITGVAKHVQSFKLMLKIQKTAFTITCINTIKDDIYGVFIYFKKLTRFHTKVKDF